MDQVRADADQDMDIWTGGWQFSFAPNPEGIWGRTEFNRARWISDEWEEIFADIASIDSWNPEFLADTMARWEQVFYQDAVALPVTYQVAYFAVNNRVSNFDITRGTGVNTLQGGNRTHLIGLTATTPYSN